MHILNDGLPFPPVSVDTLTTTSLEDLVIRSLKLTDFWIEFPPSSASHVLAKFPACSGTGVSEVRFLPAHPSWVVTVTRGIWPLITCWDISEGENEGVVSQAISSRKVAGWFRKGALFTGITVNSDPTSDACLAVSLSFAGYVSWLKFGCSV